MKKWNLSALVGVSAYTEVEAETKAEAIEIAQGRLPTLGGMGSGADPQEEWVIEEADGMPQNITAEED